MEIETPLRDKASQMENNGLERYLWGTEVRTNHKILLYPESEVLAAYPLQNFRITMSQ